MKNDQIINGLNEYIGDRYQPCEYPALRQQTTEWSESKPLAGIRILDNTPLFTNTLLKYIPLLSGGAELTLAISERTPYDSSLIPVMRSLGIRVIENCNQGDFDCILDCGGSHAHLKPRYGYAELTRSGYYHYKDTELPVILVDDSRIKAIETCLGTGDGFLRAMKQLGHKDFTNRKIIVFGFGKVGCGIVYYAMKEGAEVRIVDEPGTLIPPGTELISRYDSDAIAAAVRQAWCVVTATGIRDAMLQNGAAEEILAGKQLVAAMGIENEWGSSLPEERILNHNIPLNFILEEPTRLRYIDPTMALSNVAALALLSGKIPPGVNRIAPETEKFYMDIVENEGLITEDLKGAGLI